ncbi:hypothetical protein [Sulfurovum sp.]|jgi:hypothetical protein|uniref:hypothetical protein n=1 Tax=Sulfurovum sp. TaxID=1969726 RepID=UPI002A35E3D8|nr:hypothetical protein [Sulfurovum sp.]MDD2450850.1 hypothetical protein [Sulfurovum sp.]MDD3499336.1 hypothetical protein [Sulfurovum sp.]MDY0402144.1 hypothetical protein [Sulfurovum sp.]
MKIFKFFFIAVSFFYLNIFLFSSDDFKNTTQMAFNKELNNRTNRNMEDPQKEINVTKEKAGYQAEYTNGRFGFTLVYPENLFATRILSDNGDGITLYNSDRSLELRAYGSWYGENIKQIYHEEQSWAEESGKKVTYKVLNKSWFVLSGIDKSKQTIFYLKSYFIEGKSLSFRLEYPIADKEKYDSLISTINDNFSIR